MTILNIKLDQVGEVGVRPRIVRIDTNNTIAEVTATGFLNDAVRNGFSFSEEDYCLVSTKTSPSATATQVGAYEVSKSGSNWSLVSTGNPGEVTLPTVASYIAHFTNTTGTLASTAGAVINAGNISAGLSGTAGYFASFPATAAKGSLRLVAVANTGDTVTTISNAAMGQASVVSIPDPGAATGQFGVTAGALVDNNVITADGTAGRMQDSGVAIADVQLNTNIIAAQSADIGGGGAGPIDVTVTGLTAASVVTASILSSTNVVSVAKVLPGTDKFSITFDADPGAACVLNYVAFVAAQ